MEEAPSPDTLLREESTTLQHGRDATPSKVWLPGMLTTVFDTLYVPCQLEITSTFNYQHAILDGTFPTRGFAFFAGIIIDVTFSRHPLIDECSIF